MPIRMLAFALLAGFSLAHAAPPKSNAPQDPQAAEPIDVDALARAKDVGATPAAEDAPPAAALESTPPAAASMAAPTHAPPSVEPSSAAAPEVAAPAAADTAVNPADAAPASVEPARAVSASPAAAQANAGAAASSDTQQKVSIAASCQARATSLLDDAEKGDFAGATRDFDAKMRTALPAPKFKDAWTQLAQFGKLNARGQSHLSSAEGYTVIMVPLIFDKANLVAQISCGTDGRIAGFYVKPIEAPAP